jgi:hypothetical protein
LNFEASCGVERRPGTREVFSTPGTVREASLALAMMIRSLTLLQTAVLFSRPTN